MTYACVISVILSYQIYLARANFVVKRNRYKYSITVQLVVFVCKNVTGRRWHSGWRLYSRSHAPREPHHYTHAADFAWYGVMYRHKTWRCFWCYIFSACWHNETDNRNKVSCYKHVDGWEHQGTMSTFLKKLWFWYRSIFLSLPGQNGKF